VGDESRYGDGRAGLPSAGQVPAFGDARVRDLLGRAAAGLRPRSDAELLPVLLELVGSKIPVSQWPTRMTKTQRTGHAREVAQASAAAADRPAAAAGGPVGEQGNVTPLRWRQRAGQARDAVDADRRRRREAAVPVVPKPPPPLGASYRDRNVFVIPHEEDRGPAGRG